MAPLRTTRLSLFERLGRGPGDPHAWGEFVALYGPAVVQWCGGHGLQDSDAHDVAQEVLVRFWRQAERFRYDPSRRFRSYLRRMVVSAVADWSESRKRDRMPLAAPALEQLLASVPARDDLAARIEQTFDTELLAIAMEEVEGRVSGPVWQAFRLLAIERLPAKEVATRLAMTTNHAYVARFKVQRMIRETIDRLEGAVEGAFDSAAPG